MRLAALLLLLTAACTNPSTPSPGGLASPPASAQPSDGTGLTPGQPVDASVILAAMQTSPRPDGVPAELQTDAIAAAIAEEIWTRDGGSWDAMVVGGTCGSSSCQLEVAGVRDGAAGDDVWTFAVVPSTGEVSVESTDLRALPEELLADLDDLARAQLTAPGLDDMILTSAAWLPPPDVERYAMSYRSGGEEGSCGADLVLDLRNEVIVEERAVGDC